MQVIRHSHSCEIRTATRIVSAPFSGKKVDRLEKYLKSVSDNDLQQHHTKMKMLMNHISVWFHEGTYWKPLHSFDAPRSI